MQCYNRYFKALIMQANVAYSKELNNAHFANNWYLDTGATHHATPNAATLQEVEEYTLLII